MSGSEGVKWGGAEPNTYASDLLLRWYTDWEQVSSVHWDESEKNHE